jgi:hypothetical protein
MKLPFDCMWETYSDEYTGLLGDLEHNRPDFYECDGWVRASEVV